MEILTPTAPANPRLVRAAATNRFVEVLGERIALFGAETGPLELWAWPIKVASGLRMRLVDGAPRDGSSTRSEAVSEIVGVEVLPEATVFLFDGAAGAARVTAFAARDERALVLRIEREGAARFQLSFHCDFRPMWPAGLGGQLSGIDREARAFYLSEELGRFAFVFGAPLAPDRLTIDVPPTDHALPPGSVTLTLDADDERERMDVLVLAGAEVEPTPLSEAERRGEGQAATGVSRARIAVAEALALCARIGATHAATLDAARAHFARFLATTTSIETPSAQLDEAYLWSKLAIERAWVRVDGLGRGLVAGIGSSGHGERPGYAWFFDGDAMCGARAFDQMGASASAREVLRFAASHQRDDGKLMHELTLSARLCDWLGDYPYAYYKALNTPDFVACVAHHVERSGDVELARELWPNVERALRWCIGVLDGAGRMSNERAGLGAVEAGALSDRIESETFLHGAYVEALRGAVSLARRIGADATGYAKALDAARAALDSFWSDARGRHGFAFLDDGSRNDDLSGYVARAFANGEADSTRIAATLAQMNAPELCADWGARMFATDSAAYDPASYNTGAVFPYVTSFLTLAQFRHGHAAAGWQVLASQAALVHFGGLGLLEEHLVGDRLSIPRRGVAHQVFSSTAIVEGVLAGLFGLDADASAGTLTVRPSLPPGWTRAAVRGVPVGDARVDVELSLEGGRYRLDWTRTTGPERNGPRVRFAPVLPPLSSVTGAETTTLASGAVSVEPLDASPAPAATGATGSASFDMVLGPVLDFAAPLPGRDQPSRSPRLVGQRVDGTSRVTWTIAGRAGATASLPFACERPCVVDGARLSGGTLTVTFPRGESDGDDTWTRTDVTVELA